MSGSPQYSTDTTRLSLIARADKYLNTGSGEYASEIMRDMAEFIRKMPSDAAQAAGTPLIAWMMKDKKTGELKPYQDSENTLPLTIYEPSDLTKQQHEETGPYLVAKVEIREVLEPQGTFECPICGLDSPHTHSATEVAARVQPASFAYTAKDHREEVAALFKTYIPDLSDGSWSIAAVRYAMFELLHDVDDVLSSMSSTDGATP